MSMRLLTALVCYASTTSIAVAEPRELRLPDGTVIGAIAVSPPPEWVTDPEYPDHLEALLEQDGPWPLSTFGHPSNRQPDGPRLTLMLGRTVDDVPRPPTSTIRTLRVDLLPTGDPGRSVIGSFRCTTTEVIGQNDRGLWQVRLYREGPSGERYVLEGYASTQPLPGDCGARVAYVDTGNIPASWARVSSHGAPPKTAFWWPRNSRCERWAFTRQGLESRHVDRVDGCTITTEQSFEVSTSDNALYLSQYWSKTTSSCVGGGSVGMAGSSSFRAYRILVSSPSGWSWLDQGSALAQAPIAYHPDDAGHWFRTKKACEVHLRRP